MNIDVDSLPLEARKALEQFKEFKLSEFNDSGANGYIMIGRHSVLHKDVALKIYFHDEDEIDQEPALVSSINHENVLKVYDARKVEKNCSFYMMQAANDGDLFNFLEKYYVSLGLAHRLLCQLLSGISALHSEEKKLVHRDLKPENLLVHNDTIVIADFGSVRRVDDATGKAPASKHSILYRPPEAFGDGAFFDYSSDVYQAGMIGYLLFGGKLSSDLLSYMKKKELKELKKKGEGYEASVFVDSCIENRIQTNRLLDWNSMPIFVPNAVKRVLKTAVACHEKRLKNASELLSGLAKIKLDLPEWMQTGKGYKLENWKGNDYKLAKMNGKVILEKRKHGKSDYRKDNRVSGSTYEEAYSQLKEYIGLP